MSNNNDRVDISSEIELIPRDDKAGLKEFATVVKQIGQKMIESTSLAFIGYVYYALNKKILIGDDRFKITVQDEKTNDEKEVINVIAFTDGTSISYTAIRFYDKSLLYPSMTSIALHELIHVVSFHAGIKSRMLDKVKRLKVEDEIFFHAIWTMAQEHTVNSVIEQLSDEVDRNRIKIRKGIGIYFQEIFDAIPNASVEQVYEYMKKENGFNFKPKSKKQSKCSKCNGTGEVDKNNKDNEKDEDSNGENRDDENGDTDGNNEKEPCPDCNGSGDGSDVYEYESDKYDLKIEGDPTSGGYKLTITDKSTGNQQIYYGDGTGTDGSNMNEDTLNDMRSQVDMLRNQWNGTFGGQQKGNMPAGLSDYLDNIYKRRIPWDVLYRNAVYHIAATCDNERTYTRPNEIYSEEIPEIPGYLEEERLKYLIVGIDTSGSQDDDVLRVIIGTLLDVISYFDHILVLYHDVDVQKEVYLDAMEHTEDSVLEELRNIKGRGGTSHGPVFDRIKEISENNDPSEEVEISGIIFYTDFYSDVESIVDDYRILKDVPVVWAIDDTGAHKEANNTLGANHEVIVITRKGDLLDLYRE